jgi:hypothetical protein
MRAYRQGTEVAGLLDGTRISAKLIVAERCRNAHCA